WRKILRDYYLTTNADNVDKSVFPLLLKKLYTNALRPAYCSGGFAKAGIYPYDKRAIPKEKISYSATSSSNSGQPCLTRALSNEYLLPVHDHMTNNNRILNNNESGYYRLRRSPSAPLLSSTLNEIAASTAILNDTVTTPMSTTSISSSVLSMNKSLTFQTDNLVSIASPITSVPKPPILSSSSIVGKSFSLLNSSQVQNVSSISFDLSTESNAITTTLQRYLTPTIVRNTQRKTMVERSSDESLTSVEALHQLQAKDIAREKKKIKANAVANLAKKPRTTKAKRAMNFSDEGVLVAQPTASNLLPSILPLQPTLFPIYNSYVSSTLFPSSSTTEYPLFSSQTQHFVDISRSNYDQQTAMNCCICSNVIAPSTTYSNCVSCNNVICFFCYQFGQTPSTFVCEFCQIAARDLPPIY
ncbi:unnamed protein product, partial [Didymodactylos carnosus]